jgi:excinuclease ABC subunit C
MIDLSRLPDAPGCYRFRDRSGTVIYIGKAKNLKKRVSGYFQKRDHDQKTAAMVGQIDSFDFIVTNTDVEAYILENNLIKAHQPKYNIDLRDSKRYAYIALSDEEFPRLSITRSARGEGSFFGPFVSAAERDHVFSAVKKVFRLRTCRRLTKRSCLRYHMGSCSAPCKGKVTPGEYRVQVEEAVAVLRGRSAELIADLKSEMQHWSGQQEFEKAISIRDRIAAVERLDTRQHVEREKRFDQDALDFAVSEGRVHLMVFKLYRGKLVEKEEFSFDYSEDFFEEFILQYYGENTIPQEIIVPQEIDPALIEALCSRAGRSIRLAVPQRGEKRHLLDLVRKNIEKTVFGEAAKAGELGNSLNLDRVPHVIECFDISHLSGTSMVGAMVRFRDGAPDKKHYRRFKIRMVEGIDDFQSIAEVVKRRYRRLTEEGNSLPDLVLIDGGKGQLDAALGALREAGVDIPAVALAKREEDVYMPGRMLPLQLDRKGTALKYLQEIRNEAHRFAIAYNRLLRKKKVVG